MRNYGRILLCNISQKIVEGGIFMKKRIKSFCAALLAIIIIFSSSATISDAASKQLIIINSSEVL